MVSGAPGTGRRRPAGSTWGSQTENLLRDWRNRASAASKAHYTIATRLRRQNVLLGVPVVVFSTVVGTSLFATLTEQRVNTTLRLVIGSISVAAAILAGLQTFLRFGERAEKHVIAADWYAALRRDMDEVLALPREARETPKECLDRLRKDLSKVGQQSPEIPEDLWVKKAREYGVKDQLPEPVSGDRESRGPWILR